MQLPIRMKISMKEENYKSSVLINNGLKIINKELKTFPNKPGIYKMIDKLDNILYIGKAKNLKKRVCSYTKLEKLSIRLKRMVSETKHLEIIITQTEIEALLLESNLIKKYKPRYNILLRDDKTFPNILITASNKFPQIKKHRGKKNQKGFYFGPFASAGSVNKTIDALQKAFLIRNCNDNVFKIRTKPCLQYQIKRCTAPCVGLVSSDLYGSQVKETKMFLSGKSNDVQINFAKKMQLSSDNLDFENAALWRNRIRALTSIQSFQNINVQGLKDADVLALCKKDNKIAIHISFMRSGSNCGSHTFFPTQVLDKNINEVMTAFVNQFYESNTPPHEIILSNEINEKNLISSTLSSLSGRIVKISIPNKGSKKDLVNFALKNASETLNRKLADEDLNNKNILELEKLFKTNKPIQRIEVYDNSHFQGKYSVGAMIVANKEGFIKSSYRKFNFQINEGKIGGNDYLMMREMVNRRFQNIKKNNKNINSAIIPDLILIDGGRGHLNIVNKVLKELKFNNILVCAISKGANRNAGNEMFHMINKESFTLQKNSQTMFYLQRLRDEAHRFAITSHKARRGKAIKYNPLDEINGIGFKKKQSLLKHFGSAKDVARSSINNLKVVDGISDTVAKRIYNFFQR